MSDIIKELKENEVPFGLMSEAMQAKFREVYTPLNLDIYLPDGWAICGSSDFLSENTYRLRPDYEEKPEIVECEVHDLNGELGYWVYPGNPPCFNLLTHAIVRHDFVGFKYEADDGIIATYARGYMRKDTGCVYYGIKMKDLDDYEVLTPTAVLFKKG